MTITGFFASRISWATGSTSSGEECVEPGGTIGLASRPSHSSRRISSGMFRYAGPAGARQASSAARVTMPGSVCTSAASLAHFVKGCAMPCGPPTIDRLRYHWPPGSGPAPSPYVVDSDEATTMGTPASSAPCTAIDPCNRPGAACSSTPCGRRFTSPYPVAMPAATVSCVRSRYCGAGSPSRWRRARDSHTGAHSDPEEQNR